MQLQEDRPVDLYMVAQQNAHQINSRQCDDDKKKIAFRIGLGLVVYSLIMGAFHFGYRTISLDETIHLSSSAACLRVAAIFVGE